MARKITFGILGFLALTIVTALLIPFFVDLNSYKGEISQKVKEATGRDLVLEGPINLSLLPSPSVTIERASLSNHSDAQAPKLVSFDKIRVDIALLPLLKKKLQVSNVHLLSPTINLEVFENGTNNWTFPDLDKEKEPLKSGPEDVNEEPFSFSFDHIEVINADINYQDGKTLHSLKKLTTRLKIADLKGPFKADGFFNFFDRDVQFDVKIKEIGEKIPVDLEFDSMGLEIELKGDINQSKGSFQGDLKISGDTKSIEKASKKSVKLPSFLGDKLSFSGYVIADKDGIDIQNLNFKADDEKLKGRLSARLNPLSFSGTLRGLPGQLALNFSGKPQKSGLAGEVDLSLSSPRDFFVWIDQDWPKKMGNGRLTFKSAFSKKGETFSFSELNAKFNGSSLSGSGSFDPTKRSLSYDIKGQDLTKTVSAFVKDFPVKLSSLSVKGNTSFDKEGKNIRTKTSLVLPGAQTNIEGAILLNDKSLPSFDLKTSLSVTHPEKLMGKAPVKSLDFQAQLTQKSKILSATALNASFGIGQSKVSLSGDTKFSFSGKPKLTGNLSVGPLNLSKAFPSDKKKNTSPPKETPSPRNSTGVKAPWSTDTIDLSFLRDFDADVSFSAPSITYEDHTFKKVSAKLSLEKGLLQVPSLTGEIYGGKLNLGFSFEGGKQSTLKFTASLDDLLLNRALSKMKDEKIRIVRGELDGLVNLTTTGNSLSSWVSDLDGLVNLKATKGLVDGFDLKSISRKLKSLNTIDAFLNLFKTAMSTGQTAFSDFSLAIAFKKGVGSINKLILIADGGEGSGRGTINLPNYTIDLSTNFRLTDHEQLPPFKMSLQGPLDNPKKVFDTSDLEAYLVSNVFKKLIGGIATGGPVGAVVSDILGNITGGSDEKKSDGAQSSSQKSPANTNDAPGNPVEKVIEAPAKAVENLIKGLF